MRVLSIGLSGELLQSVRNAGHTVDVYRPATTSSILELLNTTSYDVVCLNCSGGNCTERSVTAIRERETNAVVIGVSSCCVLSAWSRRRTSFLDAGADDFILAPCEPDELWASVRRIFGRGTSLMVARSDSALKTRVFTLCDATLTVDFELKELDINGTHLGNRRPLKQILFLLASDPSKSYTFEELLELIHSGEFNSMPDNAKENFRSYLSRAKHALAEIHPDAKFLDTVKIQGEQPRRLRYCMNSSAEMHEVAMENLEYA